jgi:hypothetical protein
MKKKNYSCLYFVVKVFPLFLVLLFANTGRSQTNPTAQTLPYTQNFGTTSFSTLPDGWAAWNGISGGATATQALAESSAPTGNATVAVSTASGTTAGVFGLVLSSNAKLYVQTSGNATNGANQLALSIVTTGRSNVIVNYDVEMINAQTRLIGIVMQYRVGNTGTWTTVVADGNPYSQTGGTTGLKVSPSVALPSAANDKPVVQLRWAVWRGTESGGSSGIAIDNISVTSSSLNTVPTVTDVAIASLPNTGVQLTGSYVYADSEGDADASTYQWYTATDELGTGSAAIGGAVSVNYTLTSNELGKYIRLRVIPAAATGTSPGTEVFSPWIGPVNTAGTPVLNAGLLNNFDPTCINTTSVVANTFTLMGNNLESNVTVGPLTGFGFSFTENGNYVFSLIISPTAQAINTTVYVRFLPALVQSYDGAIGITGGGATAVNVDVVGSGINTATTALTDISFGITSSLATITGNLTEGCSPVNAYGIEYSTTNNFANGSGTNVTSDNINAGNFTVSITGLESNTTYYYKAYATDGIETVYGIQNSFTTDSVANPIAIAATTLTQTGFTANWQAVSGATGYKIDVYEVVAGANASDLFISEYIEGSSNNKYIEIFNGTGAAVDLSNYELRSYSNGATTFTSNVLSGTLANNTTIVYRNSSAAIFAGTTTIASAVNFNGDDAVSLFKISTTSLVDIFGRIGSDPGTEWTGDGGYSTVNKTLVRKATVSGGVTVSPTGTGVTAFTTLTTEWDLFDIDTVSNLGSHTFAGGSSSTLIVDNQNVGNVTSFAVTGLDSGTEYYYVVRATDATSTSSDSNEIPVTTLIGVTTYENGVWNNGIPTPDLDAVILSDFTTTVDFNAKSVTVTSGVFTVASGTTLTVTNALINNAEMANFIVESNGVVLQNSDVTNTGMFTVKRNSADLFRQDYTLWSSPVGGQNLRAFSPQTLFNRFSTYDNSIVPNGNFVQEIVTVADMNTKLFTSGKGYLIRMPNNWVNWDNSNPVAAPYLGSYAGTLNNGAYTIGLSGSNNRLNLVGNPYPSPISIAAFFTANMNVEQTLYFWRKQASINPLNVSKSGYATYSNMGFVSADLSINNQVPTTIQTGQGFFVVANSITPGNLVFNNIMRTDVTATFYRSSEESATELSRFWLNLSTDANLVGQTLVGYATAATQGADGGIDAPYFNDGAVALTSLINANEYIIQGRSLPFIDTDVVPLGFKSDLAGAFTIALNNFDGLFADNQAIFLKDNATGIVTNLKLADYSFTTSVGVFNERFQVQYTNSVLGTDNPVAAAPAVLIAVNDQKIKINAGSIIMDKVELIDISGRIIYTQEGINASVVILDNAMPTNQMLIVRIRTKANTVVSQKLIF